MQVVLIAPVEPDHVAEIAAVDARLRVEDAWELFGPELVADWPAHTVEWYLPRRFREMADSPEQRLRRDALLHGIPLVTHNAKDYQGVDKLVVVSETK